MRIARSAVALAAGLALADASVVVLALPPILIDLDTSVRGVATVIGAYTLALAAALLPAAAMVRRADARHVAIVAMALFAVSSVGCGLSPGLGVLVAMRAIQGAAAAGVLVAAFALLTAAPAGRGVSRVWIMTGILGAAVGPALGGAITQLLDWRAIFFVQAPLVAVAAALLLVGRSAGTPAAAAREAVGKDRAGARLPRRHRVGVTVGLGLVSAALTGVLFLLVLLLVAGWALSPLASAGVVSILPVAAIAGALAGSRAARRSADVGWLPATAGSVLVGAGVIALAFLPVDNVWMLVVPEVAAGLGMGLALPALAGRILPERTVAQAARLLAVRHLGITLALVALAPLIASRLDHAETTARLDGAALVLDAPLASKEKVGLARVAAGGFSSVAPRADVRDALDGSRSDIAAADRPSFDRLRHDVDTMVVTTVDGSFGPAFLACGGFALLGALLLGVLALSALPSAARRTAVIGTVTSLVVGFAVIFGQSVVAAGAAPAPVLLYDPCFDRKLPKAKAAGAADSAIADQVLKKLDKYACDYGSTREELVVALVLPSAAADYDDSYGVNPQQKFADIIALVRKLAD